MTGTERSSVLSGKQEEKPRSEQVAVGMNVQRFSCMTSSERQVSADSDGPHDAITPNHPLHCTQSWLLR